MEQFKSEKWPHFDKAQERVQGLLGEVPQLRDSFDFEQIARVSIYSYERRKDRRKMVRALSAYRQINMPEIFSDVGRTIYSYIEVMQSSFAVELFAEGFSLMEVVNSTPLQALQLASVKQKIQADKFKSIVVHAMASGLNELEEQLIT